MAAWSLWSLLPEAQLLRLALLCSGLSVACWLPSALQLDWGVLQGWIPNLERKLEVAAETAHADFRCFFSAEPINGAPQVSFDTPLLCKTWAVWLLPSVITDPV